jgi:small subunit ribosomal protein S30e
MQGWGGYLFWRTTSQGLSSYAERRINRRWNCMPTHGSLTKAGKVRAQTPNVDKTSNKGKTIPRVKNRVNYTRRIVNSRENGWNRRRRR